MYNGWIIKLSKNKFNDNILEHENGLNFGNLLKIFISTKVCLFRDISKAFKKYSVFSI